MRVVFGYFALWILLGAVCYLAYTELLAGW